MNDGWEQCSLEGCDRARKHPLAGFCGMHYQRFRKYGDAGPAETFRSHIRLPCTVDECDNNRYCGGMCITHYQRLRSHGTTAAPVAPAGSLHWNWKGDQATYRTVHSRLTNQRGRANEYACVDCGESAANWSYSGRSTEPRTENGLVYSANLEDYDPRCTRCHVVFDKGNACRNGHEYTSANTYTAPDGRRFCRECRSLRYAKQKAKANA